LIPKKIAAAIKIIENKIFNAPDVIKMIQITVSQKNIELLTPDLNTYFSSTNKHLRSI
jgi:hypothetical protein